MSRLSLSFLHMIILVIFLIPGFGRQKNVGFTDYNISRVFFPQHMTGWKSFFSIKNIYVQEKTSKASNQFKKSSLNFIFLEREYIQSI